MPVVVAVRDDRKAPDQFLLRLVGFVVKQPIDAPPNVTVLLLLGMPMRIDIVFPAKDAHRES